MNKKQRLMDKSIIKIITTLLVLVVCVMPINAYANDTSVEIKVNGKIEKGSNIEILVNVKNVEKLYAASVDFTYDTNLLSIESINGSELITKNIDNIMELGGETNKNGNTASYSFTFLGENEGIKGSGTLISINAKVLNDINISIGQDAMKVKLVQRIGNDVENYKFNFIGCEIKTNSSNNNTGNDESNNNTNNDGSNNVGNNGSENNNASGGNGSQGSTGSNGNNSQSNNNNSQGNTNNSSSSNNNNGSQIKPNNTSSNSNVNKKEDKNNKLQSENNSNESESSSNIDNDDNNVNDDNKLNVGNEKVEVKNENLLTNNVNNTWIYLILACVGISILGGIGYFFYKNKRIN